MPVAEGVDAVALLPLIQEIMRRTVDDRLQDRLSTQEPPVGVATQISNDADWSDDKTIEQHITGKLICHFLQIWKCVLFKVLDFTEFAVPDTTDDLTSNSGNVLEQSQWPWEELQHVKTCQLDSFVLNFYNHDNSTELRTRLANATADGRHTFSFFTGIVAMNAVMMQLIQNAVLHRMILLDHIARCIDPIAMQKYHHRAHILNGAICTYITSTYGGKVVVLNHHKPGTHTQVDIVIEIFAQLRSSMFEVGSSIKLPFRSVSSPVGEWLADIERILLADALRVDTELGDLRAPGKLLMFSEHITRTANPNFAQFTSLQLWGLARSKSTVTQSITGESSACV